MEQERKRVWLSIIGTVSDVKSGAEDTMEMMTEGDLYREHNTSCVTYKESEVSGMEGTTTTLKLEDGKVSVIRLGTVNSIMEFEEGTTSLTTYATPYGEMIMGVRTKGICVDYDDDKDPVHVKINYAIEVQGVTNSENRLNIKINRERA